LEASSFFEQPNCTYPFGTHIVAGEELLNARLDDILKRNPR
jgi:hypothetical protein